MAINNYEAQDIIKASVENFRTRVNAQYVELTTEDLEQIMNVMDEVLSKYTSNANIERRQYNPITDQVEDI